MPFRVSTGLRFHPQVSPNPHLCVCVVIHVVATVAFSGFHGPSSVYSGKEAEAEVVHKGDMRCGDTVAWMLYTDEYRAWKIAQRLVYCCLQAMTKCTHSVICSEVYLKAKAAKPGDVP